MSTRPTIRTLTDADLHDYVALRKAMLLDSPPAFSSSPDDDRWRDEAGARDRFRDPDQAIIGGFDAHQLVASAGVYRDPHLKMAHRAWIWGVWTRPEHRRRGLGEAVVRGAIDLARTWPGVERLCLSSSTAQHSAVRLYERLGFARWGIEPDALRLDGRSYDEVHMQLMLDRSVIPPPPGPRSP